MAKVSESKKQPFQHPKCRRFYLLEDVEEHCTLEDCWLVVHGRVLDISSLLTCKKGDPLSRPLVAHAGQDLSHWFEKETGEPKKFFDIARGQRCFYLPHGRFLHLPPDFPGEFDYDFDTPWWKDPRFEVGRLTAKPRNIRIINTLTHHQETLVVPAEETLQEIQTRYLEINKHSQSYTWKDCYAKVLDLEKTLEENGIHDEDAEYDYLDVPDSQRHVPAIMIYFNDDLTEA